MPPMLAVSLTELAVSLTALLGNGLFYGVFEMPFCIYIRGRERRGGGRVNHPPPSEESQDRVFVPESGLITVVLSL